MVTVVKPTPSLGERFGTGLSQGLSLLAQNKLQELSQRNQARGLESLGFNSAESSALASLDPSIQKEFVKQRLAAPSQEAFAQSLSELLGGAAPETGISALGQPQVRMTEAQEAAQMRQKPRLTERQATELARLGLKKQGMAQKEKAEAFKATKAERKQIIDNAKTARQNLHDLERLEDLQKEGKLDTPGYVEFLKRSGLDIPALMNPGSQEFNKVVANFIREAKSLFGNKVSNFEIEQFLRTLPNLSQSPEGRSRVIANLKNISRANLAYKEALKEIIEENKGIPPLDLSEQIDDRMEKKLDKISKKFKEDLSKPVPKGQSPYITGLEAVAGTVAGRIPKAALGAGIGAYGLGSKFGPHGAVAGGILGGLAGLSGLNIKDLF